MQDNRFKSTMAVLVAFVSVMGAVTAYLATVAASSAGDEDFTGHNASINAQKIENVNYINTYEHYRAFGEYSHYLELGNLMYDPSADEKTSIENARSNARLGGLRAGSSIMVSLIPDMFQLMTPIISSANWTKHGKMQP